MLKKEKPKEVEKIVSLIEKYPVVGVISMHKMPGRQLQQIKQMLKGKALIKVAKKSLIFHAFNNSGKEGIKKLGDVTEGEAALIFTDANPFSLYKDVRKIKSPASAKAGDMAPKDIEIKAGPTELVPGPAITALQKTGLKTKVEGGKISIISDKVVCKQGEKITPDLVNLFSMLKMQPMEIGLNVVAVLEKGIVYGKDVLSIDEEQYLKDISNAIGHMINLSVFIGYPTKETAEIMLQKAYREMKSLGIDANLIEKEIIPDLIAKAEMQAKSLEKNIK